MRASDAKAIGFAISVGIALIVYLVIPLLKALFRRNSYSSGYNFASRRPVAITVVGILCVLGYTWQLIAGIKLLFENIDFPLIILTLTGFWGLMSSIALFRMSRLAAISLFITFGIQLLFYLWLFMDGFFNTELLTVAFIHSAILLVYSLILFKYLPNMQ